MHKGNIVLFRKLSKLEWDAMRSGNALESMSTIYKQQGLDVVAIIESHHRQINNFTKIRSLLKRHHHIDPPIIDSSCFLTGDHVALTTLSNADMVIASVGDELATSLGRIIKQGSLLPINADPLTSEGALLWPSVEFFERYIEILFSSLKYEMWPRIRVVLNGQVLGDAIGDVYIGSKERLKISDYFIQPIPSILPEHQRSSGIIISTGAGSSGWYRSTYWDSYIPYEPEQLSFPFFVASEPYRGKLSNCQLIKSALKVGDTITMRSLMPDGIIALDNREIITFNRESTTKIVAKDSAIEVINDRFHGEASKEVFIGNRYRQWISRYILTDQYSEQHHQKSSGLIIATKKGAERWLIPALSTLSDGPNTDATFKRTETILKYIITEPTLLNYQNTHGQITRDTHLTVRSNMPSTGVISLDSYTNHDFPADSQVEISISPDPIKMVVPC